MAIKKDLTYKEMFHLKQGKLIPLDTFAIEGGVPKKVATLTHPQLAQQHPQDYEKAGMVWTPGYTWTANQTYSAFGNYIAPSQMVKIQTVEGEPIPSCQLVRFRLEPPSLEDFVFDNEAHYIAITRISIYLYNKASGSDRNIGAPSISTQTYNSSARPILNVTAVPPNTALPVMYSACSINYSKHAAVTNDMVKAFFEKVKLSLVFAADDGSVIPFDDSLLDRISLSDML